MTTDQQPQPAAVLSEDPRADCPWCGSVRLRVRLRTVDPGRRLPGPFVLDECLDCGHTFQNPRLTPEDLARHHRARHLAPGGHRDDGTVRHPPRRHRAVLAAVLRFGEPESWLDVGTVDAAFCAAARQARPYTAYDALGTHPVLAEALADGRLDEAHRGTLPELAPELAGRYDVVSMFHHLEQTADPRAELAAARTVLRPGGHLVVETPDPRSRTARLLGRWWIWYEQPRRPHLMPLRNLRRELEELGYTVVAAERRGAHVPLDLSAALARLLGSRLPADGAPWRTRPRGPLHRAARRLALRAAAPALSAARLLDRLLAPAVRRSRYANAYRLVARKEAGLATAASRAAVGPGPR
ncbi:class I SAM-dependent methyltransferase [Streptomyces sp. NPDC058045]|uniref:class I SAM-dependent methyltransferase n=1 Tax=Streptomyces sp. NPDC058045 TaxID=3346311 RepID=UPI0036E3112A